MAFQVSVTHWFLLTPFCHRAAVVSRETGEQRGKGASWKQGQRDKGETRGMKNGKAERGGHPGSEWGAEADRQDLREDNVREKEQL